MSTRSEIQFKEEVEDEEGKIKDYSVRIYKHSDGYPEGNVESLYKFYKWLGVSGRDAEYDAANYLYWAKKDYAGKYGEDFAKLGFGVENAQRPYSKPEHGDIEFTYEVETKNIGTNIKPKYEKYIKIYDINEEKEIFKGTLEEAYKMYVKKEEEKRKLKV